MDVKQKLEDIAKESSKYLWHDKKNEKYKHEDVFDCVQYAIEHNFDINSKDFYQGNLASLLLDIYYNEYFAYEVFDEDEIVVNINQKNEALIPLNERKSCILNELMYLKNNGYNFNNCTTLVDPTLEDNDQAPVFCVMKWPTDNLMLQWLINNGCKDQMLLLFSPKESDIDCPTMVDWCFDNIDLSMEDILYAEDNTGNDYTFLYKLAADTIRTMLQNGATRKGGMFIDINKENKVSYHHMRMKY